MSLQADYQTASGDEVSRQRVLMAIVSTALAVQSEATSTANHAARSAGALQVLSNPSGWRDVMAPGMFVDGSLTSASTDAQFESRASAIWNAYFVAS